VIRTNVVTGVRYTDERPEDCDAHGVLWHRHDPGRGEPFFAKIYTARLRRAMVRVPWGGVRAGFHPDVRGDVDGVAGGLGRRGDRASALNASRSLSR